MKKFTVYCERDLSFLADAFLSEINCNCPVACEVVFTDEGEIRRLNRELRSVDSVTDVLSFPSLDGIKGRRITRKGHCEDVDEQGNLFLGSVAVCEKRAAEQAEEYGHGYERELYYLITHGVCHLLGYDHTDDAERAEMRAAEERVLARAGLSRE